MLQPLDWDDREYIDDPNDAKPEVWLIITLWKLFLSCLYMPFAYYFVSNMQGYDSIPREIPNPKAKKVLSFSTRSPILTLCDNEIYNKVPMACGLFLFPPLLFLYSLIHGMKMKMEFGNRQRYQIQLIRDHGSQRLSFLISCHNIIICWFQLSFFLSLIHLLLSAENQEPKLQGEVEDPLDRQSRWASNILKYLVNHIHRE